MSAPKTRKRPGGLHDDSDELHGTITDVWAAVVALVLVVAGAALLTVGAEAFAEHVTAASQRLGVSVLALALLLAGAEPEEAVTAMLASGQGHPALAAGDAIGANLVILTLTLGLAALVTRLPVSRRAIEYGVASAALGAVAWLFLVNGVLTRAEGLVLVLLYVAGVVGVWRRESAPPLLGEVAELAERGDADHGDNNGDGTDEATGRALLMVLLGLLGMVAGGFLAVRGAAGLVDVLHLGESVIGLTVLALATSAEMVALVWAARRRGLSEVVVAGSVGAVAYNATVSLGLAGLVSPLLLGRHNVIADVAVATAVLPLVLLVALRTGRLPRSVGALLVAGYVATIALLLAR
jgi:cation:H+ antiporter